ncbi:MAG: hypothetical protein LUC98_01700 [Lachnospiraceae bacterium]|nr:hypothetical protein [Lachnospiraceae bacterium]
MVNQSRGELSDCPVMIKLIVIPVIQLPNFFIRRLYLFKSIGLSADLFKLVSGSICFFFCGMNRFIRGRERFFQFRIMKGKLFTHTIQFLVGIIQFLRQTFVLKFKFTDTDLYRLHFPLQVVIAQFFRLLPSGHTTYCQLF